MEIQVRQIVKASKVYRRYGLYKVLVDGVRKGFIEKAYHRVTFRVGTPGINQRSFSTLQRAVDYVVSL